MAAVSNGLVPPGDGGVPATPMTDTASSIGPKAGGLATPDEKAAAAAAGTPHAFVFFAAVRHDRSLKWDAIDDAVLQNVHKTVADMCEEVPPDSAVAALLETLAVPTGMAALQNAIGAFEADRRASNIVPDAGPCAYYLLTNLRKLWSYPPPAAELDALFDRFGIDRDAMALQCRYPISKLQEDPSSRATLRLLILQLEEVVCLGMFGPRSSRVATAPSYQDRAWRHRRSMTYFDVKTSKLNATLPRLDSTELTKWPAYVYGAPDTPTNTLVPVKTVLGRLSPRAWGRPDMSLGYITGSVVRVHVFDDNIAMGLFGRWSCDVEVDTLCPMWDRVANALVAQYSSRSQRRIKYGEEILGVHKHRRYGRAKVSGVTAAFLACLVLEDEPACAKLLTLHHTGGEILEDIKRRRLAWWIGPTTFANITITLANGIVLQDPGINLNTHTRFVQFLKAYLHRDDRHLVDGTLRNGSGEGLVRDLFETFEPIADEEMFITGLLFGSAYCAAVDFALDMHAAASKSAMTRKMGAMVVGSLLLTAGSQIPNVPEQVINSWANVNTLVQTAYSDHLDRKPASILEHLTHIRTQFVLDISRLPTTPEGERFTYQAMAAWTVMVKMKGDKFGVDIGDPFPSPPGEEPTIPCRRLSEGEMKHDKKGFRARLYHMRLRPAPYYVRS